MPPPPTTLPPPPQVLDATASNCINEAASVNRVMLALLVLEACGCGIAACGYVVYLLSRVNRQAAIRGHACWLNSLLVAGKGATTWVSILQGVCSCTHYHRD